MQSPAALLAGLCALGLGASAATLAQAQVQAPADPSSPTIETSTTASAVTPSGADKADAPPPVAQRAPRADVDADSVPGLPTELMLAPAPINSDDNGVVVTQA